MIQYLFLSTLIWITSTAHAQCNPECTGLNQKSNAKVLDLTRIKVILSKNEEYLKANPSASSSIMIKVRSNILMSKLQIETLQNENQFISDEMTKKGCQACPSVIGK